MLFTVVLVWNTIGVLTITCAFWRMLAVQKLDDGIALLWGVLTSIVVVSKAGDPLREQAWLLKKLLVGTPKHRRREVLKFLLRAKILLSPMLLVLVFLGVYWGTSIYILSKLSIDYCIKYAANWLFVSLASNYLLRMFREAYIQSDDILHHLEDGGELNCDGNHCSFARLFSSVSNKRSTD